MNGRLLGFVSLLAFSWPAPALAWSEIGHRIICEIAFQELDAPVRERVEALIRQDPEFSTFAQACTWADWPRRRAMEHFVNLPRDAAGFGDDPCPTADECVVSAIEKDLAVLSSSSATEQERLEALKYLGHWLGDVHQPLHVSFEDDPGRERGRCLGRSLPVESPCRLGRLPPPAGPRGRCSIDRAGPAP